MEVDFLKARISATQALIISYETALSGLASGGVSSFSLDTGQTKQTVTKKNMSVLQNALNSAYNLLAVLEARLYGATNQVVPGW